MFEGQNAHIICKSVRARQFAKYKYEIGKRSQAVNTERGKEKGGAKGHINVLLYTGDPLWESMNCVEGTNQINFNKRKRTSRLTRISSCSRCEHAPAFYSRCQVHLVLPLRAVHIPRRAKNVPSLGEAHPPASSQASGRRGKNGGSPVRCAACRLDPVCQGGETEILLCSSKSV